MKSEPVLIILAGMAAIVGAGLEATNAVHWTDLDQSQIAAIFAFVTITAGTLCAAIRAAVVSPKTNEAQVLTALATPIPTGPQLLPTAE